MEPLALAAAIVAAGMTVYYVVLIRQQGNQPLAWVLGALLASVALAVYGTVWQAPYRRAALLAAGIALTVLGVLAILSIGLPIIASGILALVASSRQRPPPPGLDGHDAAHRGPWPGRQGGASHR